MPCVGEREREELGRVRRQVRASGERIARDNVVRVEESEVRLEREQEVLDQQRVELEDAKRKQEER